MRLDEPENQSGHFEEGKKQEVGGFIFPRQTLEAFNRYLKINKAAGMLQE
jgi:hypothetical protein